MQGIGLGPRGEMLTEADAVDEHAPDVDLCERACHPGTFDDGKVVSVSAQRAETSWGIPRPRGLFGPVGRPEPAARENQPRVAEPMRCW
jgi:hypothetical protein